MCTTIEAINLIGGAHGTAPNIVFVYPEVDDFVRAVMYWYRDHIINMKVANQRNITPPLHVVEMALAGWRGYVLRNSHAILHSLNLYDEWVAAGEIRSYTPSMMKNFDFYTLPDPLMNLVRHYSRPMYDDTTNTVYLIRPPRVTAYNVGEYPDNRATMTQIPLRHGTRTGKVDQLGLRLGIPLRRNVWTHFTTVMCAGYVIVAAMPREYLNIKAMEYYYATGPLNPALAAPVVGPNPHPPHPVIVPPVAPRYVPYEAGPDRVPLGLRQQGWNAHLAPLVGGQYDVFGLDIVNGDYRPWHQAGSYFEILGIQPINSATYPHTADPISDPRAPVMAANPDLQFGFGPPGLVAPANWPGRMAPILQNGVGIAGRVIEYFVFAEYDQNFHNLQMALPAVKVYRPTGHDAVPPQVIRDRVRTMNANANRTLLLGTWLMFESAGTYHNFETELYQHQTQLVKLDYLSTSFARDFGNRQWPKLTEKDLPPKQENPFKNYDARKKKGRGRRNRNSDEKKRETAEAKKEAPNTKDTRAVYDGRKPLNK